MVLEHVLAPHFLYLHPVAPSEQLILHWATDLHLETSLSFPSAGLLSSNGYRHGRHVRTSTEAVSELDVERGHVLKQEHLKALLDRTY